MVEITYSDPEAKKLFEEYQADKLAGMSERIQFWEEENDDVVGGALVKVFPDKLKIYFKGELCHTLTHAAHGKLFVDFILDFIYFCYDEDVKFRPKFLEKFFN